MYVVIANNIATCYTNSEAALAHIDSVPGATMQKSQVLEAYTPTEPQTHVKPAPEPVKPRQKSIRSNWSGNNTGDQISEITTMMEASAKAIGEIASRFNIANNIPDDPTQPVPVLEPVKELPVRKPRKPRTQTTKLTQWGDIRRGDLLNTTNKKRLLKSCTKLKAFAEAE